MFESEYRNWLIVYRIMIMIFVPDPQPSTSQDSLITARTPRSTRSKNVIIETQNSDEDDEEMIVINRSNSKPHDTSRRSSRLKTREQAIEAKEKKIEELQKKLGRSGRGKRNPVIEEQSESEFEEVEEEENNNDGNQSNLEERSSDEEIVISRSAAKRTPSRRITKMETKKIEKQEMIDATMGKTPHGSEKRVKAVIDSDDSDVEGRNEVGSSSKKRKRPVIDDASQDPSSLAGTYSAKGNSTYRKNQVDNAVQSDESDFQELGDDDDVDGLESEGDQDFVEEEMELENSNWRKALNEVIDSDMRMSRTSESETSAFLKVVFMYLNVAAFPGKGYPLQLTDSFKQYPPEKGPNLRKCLQTVTDKVTAMLGKYSRATSWKPDFQFTVDRFPQLSMGYTQKRKVCEACGRSNTVTSECVEFKGNSYDAKSYSLVKWRELQYNGPTYFVIGSHCSSRIEMYHLLKHYLYNLYAECKNYAEKHLLLDERRIRRKSTDIEKDLKSIASEGNDWALNLADVFLRDMNRALEQRKGLDWSFER